MAATAPLGVAARMAGVVMPADVVVSGTLWHGAAATRGHLATWDSRVWESVLARRWVADVRVTGPETELAGQWALRPGAATVAPLRGHMGWSLIEAVLPGLEIGCRTTAEVDVARAEVAPDARSASGQLRLAAGTCARVDGTVTDVPLPALIADITTTADGVGIAIKGAEAPGLPLGTVVMTPDNRLRVTIFAAGAALVPGLPVGGDSQIEIPMALFSP